MITEFTGQFSPKPGYDVCVIGGGAAGITIAKKARALGLTVFLAEGGGIDFSAESQDCYQGTVIGDEYFSLDSARLRYFGGTTNHWGGMCRPLEPHDFQANAASPKSGWPIGHADLAPHLAEASDIVEISAVPSDRTLNTPETLRRIHFVFSPPVRFGTKFRQAFADDPDFDVCLNCNAVDLDFNGRALLGVTFRNFGGHTIQVQAKTYVLACGGIENSRLLLYWNSRLNNTLGNQRGNVGRYWMEHPTQTIGTLLTCGDAGFVDDDVALPMSRRRLYIAPSRSFMEAQGILNCGIHIYRMPQSPFSSTVSNASCHVPGWISQALMSKAPDLMNLHWVRASSEQEPVWDNHVALGQEKDAFGIPRPELHWRHSRLDKKTLRTVALETGAYFARANLGRMKLHDWLLADDAGFACEGGGHCPGGFHHMGGTRMARDESAGVVDANCRVFGTENLFVAGCSVFPSGGASNPTLTIVQLGLRLATHLRTVIA